MTRPILIAPSILASDFSRLGEEIKDVVTAGADWIHLDVMDGHFVPNITFGPPVIAKLRAVSDAPYDAHLMISPADPYLEDFANAGCDVITVQAEAGPHLDRSLQRIRNLGKKAGVALNPATPVSMLENVISRVDLILIMSVNPGFGGQTFIHEALSKISQARTLAGSRPIDIQVDGGVSRANAEEIVRAGANVLVAGTAIFSGSRDDYRDNIEAIRTCAEMARGDLC